MPYLVDGNNLIGQSREQNLKDPHARVRLIRELSQFCRQRAAALTVVFDGEPDAMLPSRNVHLGNLHVIFAGRGRDADRLILDILSASSDPAGTTVVTSDRSLADRARQVRAKTLRSHQFRQILREMRIDESRSEEIRLTEDEINEWLAYFSRRESRD